MRSTSKYSLCFLLPLLMCMLLFHSGTAATNPLDIYHQANIAYQQQEYDKAIDLYEKLLSQGEFASEVYFNLANAWYKKGNVPKSVLNYERALKMDPKDEDIQFNLKIASLQLVDKIDPVPQIFYKRWIDSLTNLFSSNEWGKLVPFMLWISLLSSLFFLFGNTVLLRKAGFVVSLVFLSLFAITFVIAGFSHNSSNVDRSAIVMTPSVYVKSSPDPKGNDLFIIHEGTKVELLDELNDWKKIKLLNGSVGWLMNSEIEVI